MNLYFDAKNRKNHACRPYLHADLPEIGIYYPQTDQFLCQPYWAVAIYASLLGLAVYGSYLVAVATGFVFIWAAAVLFAAYQGYTFLFTEAVLETETEVSDSAKMLAVPPLFLLMEARLAQTYTVWTPPASVGQPVDIGLQMTAFMTWSPVAWYITFLFSATAFAYLQYVLRKAYWSA